MNRDNKPSAAEGRALGPLTENNLNSEEVKKFKNCTYSLYYKAGIPFAIFCNLMSSWLRKPEKVDFTPQSIFKRGFVFVGNVMIGTLLMVPLCYSKLLASLPDHEKNDAEFGDQKSPYFEETQPLTQAEDLNYSSVLDLSEPQDSFSLDYNTPKLLSDDQKSQKTQSTTYGDLRARHRSGLGVNKASPLNLLPAPQRWETNSGPLEDTAFSASPPPPPKIAKKNKYGDETE